MHIVIYQWGTGPNFLLQHLYPQAQVIKAQPEGDDQRIIALARQIADERQGETLHWFFQI
ncbi:MAG: hypothetical protein HRT35_38305, partial [Algicola sp.]|nr:hypothetical protein [Algicola sp.]